MKGNDYDSPKSFRVLAKSPHFNSLILFIYPGVLLSYSHELLPMIFIFNSGQFYHLFSNAHIFHNRPLYPVKQFFLEIPSYQLFGRFAFCAKKASPHSVHQVQGLPKKSTSFPLGFPVPWRAPLLISCFFAFRNVSIHKMSS